MMKKLLVLALVLSMATMASAALQISVGGTQTATEVTITDVPSGTLSLGIWTDSPIAVLDGFNGLLVATQLGSIDYLSGSVVKVDSGTSFERNGNAHYALGDSSALLPASEEGLGFYAFMFDNAATANQDILGSIAFHCEGAGDVTLKLYTVNDDYTAITLVDSVIIHQVPEPMTMTLLGLGGLFLRRRSK
jgi:hypothetical protein